MSANKPMPVTTDISSPFWEGLKQGKILLQQCNRCEGWTFYPRKHCSHCLSRDVEFREVSGRGSLYTFTVARIPTLPEFAGPEPQLMAVVELDEGVRVNTTMVGVKEQDLEIGMRVKPVRAKVSEEGTVLLRFTAEYVDLSEIDEIPKQPEAPEEPADETLRKVPLDDDAALQSLVSEEFSEWSNQVLVDQAMISQFAELSGDDYWIHTDPERARKEGPFGGPIAQGALVQVLVSRMKMSQGFEITGFTNMVNYGSDKLRFPTPVPVGSLIHSRSRVKSIERGKRGVQMILEINVHVVGQDRPAVINELVILYM